MVPDNWKPKKRSEGALKSPRSKNPWPKDRDFRILAIDGGGIRGVLPACFLAGLERLYLDGRRITEYFDLVAGTSTGGIIALGLSSGMSATQVYRLYQSLGAAVFPDYGWWPRTLRQLKGAILKPRYASSSLEALLSNAFGEKTLADANCRLCVPAFDAKYGEVYVFKTPHHVDYKVDWKVPLVKVAQATSAAPTYFRPVNDQGYQLVDGGIWANCPVMVAVVEAISAFDIDPHRISVLSLGCGSGPHEASWWDRQGLAIFNLSKLLEAGMEAQAQNALGQAGLLIGRTNLMRIDATDLVPKISMDDFDASIHRLPMKADELLEKYGEEIYANFLYGLAMDYEPIYK